MRKLTSAALALVLSAALVLPVVGTGPPRITLSSGEVKPGEAVTLTLSVADNPGLAGYYMYFFYDTSVFSVEDSDVAAGGVFRQRGAILSNDLATARKNGLELDDSRDGVLAFWFSGSGTNVEGDGEMLRLTLHANADALEGTYEIGVSCDETNTVGEDDEPLSCSVSGGSVTVKADAPVQTAPVQTPNAPEIQDALDGKTDYLPTFVESDGPGSEGTVSEKPELEKPVETPPEPEPEIMLPEFNDITGNWAESYIKKIAARGVMNGMGNGRYAPTEEMRRCEYATILWRAEGSPEPKGAAGFTDLDPAQTWYHKAVAWAGENGVMNGVGNGRFDPNGAVTREQLVTILHRLAGSPTGMETMVGAIYDAQYADSGEIQSWAKPALYWAVYNVIYCGDGSLEIGAELLPGKPADRAQIAVMMERYLESEEEKQ